MNKKYCKIATSIIIAGMTGFGNASLISQDWKSSGDGLLTYDTITGQSWLDLTVTTNKSYNDLVNPTGLVGNGEFRYATLGEVTALFNHAGIYETSASGADWFGTIQEQNVLTLINLLSPTDTGANYSDPLLANYMCSLGTIGTPSQGGHIQCLLSNIGFPSSIAGTGNNLAMPNYTYIPDSTHVTWNGNFLIKLANPSVAVITAQPQSQVGYWGKSITFSVSLNGGNPPFRYQWLKDDAPVAGATDFQLVLSNLENSAAGVYKVLVTDAGNNTISSQPATLTINPAGVSVATYAGLMIDGVIGQTYGIQATTDLSNTSGWVGVANVTLTQPTQIWYDSQSTAQQPKRFYRVAAGPISIP